MSNVDTNDGWEFIVGFTGRDEIQKYCVQDSEWQQFRLSLKGLSTNEKLRRLRLRREEHIKRDGTLSRRSTVQIDNYINALKRGGQLDDYNKVQR